MPKSTLWLIASERHAAEMKKFQIERILVELGSPQTTLTVRLFGSKPRSLAGFGDKLIDFRMFALQTQVETRDPDSVLLGIQSLFP